MASAKTYGRPRTADRRQIAKDYLLLRLPATRVAKLHGCSPRTVYYAVDECLAADDSEAEAIRNLTGHQRPDQI